MESEEMIIGYDARLSNPNIPRVDLWKEDISNIMSIDIASWHSVFDNEILLPPWTGPRQYLWDDLNRLYEELKNVSIAIQYTIVCFTQVGAQDELRIEQAKYAVEPNVLPTNWKFLGYDVADYFHLSSLTNVVYNEPEFVQLKKEFSDKLNKYYLFSSINHAKLFQEYSNSAIIEHSPFFIYGLYEVK